VLSSNFLNPLYFIDGQFLVKAIIFPPFFKDYDLVVRLLIKGTSYLL
jgi:hypothetical protein